MFTIGIDPHKGSHLAAVLDEHEQFLDELRVRADRHQRECLLQFAAPYARGVGDRRCSRAGCAGRPAAGRRGRDGAGCAGEAVDHACECSTTSCADKNDIHDARSAAIVGIRIRRLVVVGAENHGAATIALS